MGTLDMFAGLPLSPGLIKTIDEIEQLKSVDKLEAKKRTLKAINLVRISGAVLRCELAEQICQKADTDSLNSARTLFVKAIDHLNKEDPEEKKTINAIKEKMFNRLK